MNLTSEEDDMLVGKHGPIIQEAMNFLVKLGEAFGAEKMVNIDSAYIYGSSVSRITDDEFNKLKIMSGSGLKFKVHTTTHIVGNDLELWEQMGLSEELRKKQLDIIEFQRKMGAIPECTCAPYLVGNVPTKGVHIAWTESSAWIFANSILGAKGNREGIAPIYSALTGKTPLYGYHIDENRLGTILVKVETPLNGVSDYGAAGFYSGDERLRIVWEVPVFDGIRNAALRELKAFCGGISASSAIALFHIPGITPEAHSVKDAFKGQKPKEKLSVGVSELRRTYERLCNATDEKVDFVCLGCPHASIDELREIALLLDGKKVNGKTRLHIYAGKTIKALAERAGYNDLIKAAGGLIVCDTCPLIGLLGSLEVTKTVATNSAKMARYLPDMRGWEVWFGTTEQCINAAVTGKWR